jgi:uncharacterized metal-binding protein
MPHLWISLQDVLKSRSKHVAQVIHGLYLKLNYLQILLALVAIGCTGLQTASSKTLCQ